MSASRSGAARDRGTVVAADRVVTAPGRPVLRRAAVLVHDGRIAAVGARDDFGAPDVDLGERTLVAGLIDAHVHLAKWPEGGGPLPHQQTVEGQLLQTVSHVQRFLRQGVTAVRDLGSPNGVVGTVRDAVEAGTVLGCRVQTANEVITITGGHGNSFGMECDDDTALRRAVRTHVKQGSDWIKIMASGGFTNPYRSERETPYAPLFDEHQVRLLVDEAHRFGLPATAHCQGREAIAQAFEAGVDTLEHLSFAAKPVAVVDQDLARAIGQAGTPVVPTTNNYWLTVGVPWAPKDVALANLKLLHDCGIALAAGTDMGLPTTTPETYAAGLEVMAVAGLPLEDVLAAATTVAARAIGREDSMGRLDVGLCADMVALDGNPLDDVSAYSRPTWVMVGGRTAPSAADEAVWRPEPAGAAWSGVHLFGD
ncbi:amidohydrolase family protein [Kineococcus sp. SYSU DK003]|uniref:amidohydrolase family protein n=1 Tax=Kineococcus sp. SYSU DK003 TaxID=3383124 RepID=UPI003D7CBABE